MRSGGGHAGRLGVPVLIGFCTTGACVTLAEKPANADCRSGKSCDLLAPEELGEPQGPNTLRGCNEPSLVVQEHAACVRSTNPSVLCCQKRPSISFHKIAPKPSPSLPFSFSNSSQCSAARVNFLKTKPETPSQNVLYSFETPGRLPANLGCAFQSRLRAGPGPFQVSQFHMARS